MQETCAKCRFWFRAADYKHEGTCKRYPARVTDVKQPLVHHTDWCGEFKTKD